MVGLYISPPEKALVFCVDVKSQIQTLERSQPVLPMRPGKPEGHTPEHFRHGTTSLFAALDVKTGKVLGKCYPRHRAKEFLAFLKNIESHMAEDVAVLPIQADRRDHRGGLPAASRSTGMNPLSTGSPPSKPGHVRLR